MKTFLNVLYRRILYRIPLKFLLILLCIVAVFIASFSSAEQIENGMGKSLSVGSYSSYLTFSYANFNLDYTVCIGIDSTSCDINFNYNSNTYRLQGRGLYCFSGVYFFSSTSSNPSFSNNASTCSFAVNVFPTSYFSNDCPTCPTCPSQYTSLECQTEYNLIPISSVDSSYCENNNLCPICPSCPSFSGDLSNVYINNILHLGAPNIIMNIPDEIDWDYAYTNSGNNMNIDVVGYNVDYDKIEGIITVQNYKPDSYDFTNLVSNVIPLFVPGLCIILLLYFIFRFIKKIF